MKNYTGLEVAVIGMSGRFPGANNLKEFWENVKNGIESISFFTDEELINEGIDHGLVNNPLYVKANAYIKDKGYFDSSFFKCRPDEAKLMDPQIRLFHECVWNALEDAGINLNTYDGKIGLFVGSSTNVNWVICSELMNKNGFVDSFTASQLNNARFIATKISYLLNLRGPSLFLDTGCSSSLVAIQQACNSLILGDSNIALAGGVTVTNKSKNGYLYVDGMINSKDGHCCPFDVKSSGTVGGEGVGVVVLKMLKNAIKDRDHIWAIIKGTGINNDGNDKVGFTAPSINGQSKAIIRAQKWAKVEPKSISYIEAHGTATELGDPIEIEALNRVFGSSEQKYCSIGSVKSNIGHLDSAAGVAGFIKTVLALKNKQIPPSINFTSPNPKINFQNSPFYVNTELKDWKNDNYPLRAGVSSFGIGGTNAHVILEEAPVAEPTSESRDYQLILLSAKTKSSLTRNLENLKDFFDKEQDINMADVAYTLQVGRENFAYRKMLVCKNIDDAMELFSRNKGEHKIKPISGKEKQKVVFMFSGQGSQYKYMCNDLYQKESIFRQEVRKCFDIVDRKFGVNLEAIVFSNEDLDVNLNIDNTEYTQPILFTLEYALSKLLIHWGIVPDLMIGHSIGEYVAACISGVFSLEDALSLVVNRGKLMQKVPRGKMLSISISESKLKPILQDFKNISLAAVNSSEFCVVSGTKESLLLLKSFLEKENYPNSLINTSHAFHSYMMDIMLDDFEKEVGKVKINSPKIPFISNYTGKQITDDEILKPRYWSNHLRHTVRFSEGIELILKNNNAIFLEVGPGKVLSTLVSTNKFLGNEHKVVNIVKHPKEKGNDLFHLLTGIGKLWLNGLAINWDNFYQNERRRKKSLPTYSFDKIKYPINLDAYDLINKETQKSLPILEKNVGNPLYVNTWQSTISPNDAFELEKNSYNILVFSNNDNISINLIKSLRSSKQRVIEVRQGNSFKKLNNDLFEINLGDPATYSELGGYLNQSGKVINYIIYCFALNNNIGKVEYDFIEEKLNHGYLGLSYLAKAIANLKQVENLDLIVLNNNLASVISEDEVDPLKALIHGPARIIPLEILNVSCKVIDIPYPFKNETDLNNYLSSLVNEIFYKTVDPFVAYRNDKRWVQSFQKLEENEKIQSNTKIVKNGVYIITGGLGGVGFTIASDLVRNHNANVILVYRSEFPKRSEWDNWLKLKSKDDKTSKRIQQIIELETTGCVVELSQVDLVVEDQVEKFIHRIQKKHTKINGLIWAAGEVDFGGIIQNRTQSDLVKYIFAKVHGLLLFKKYMKFYELDFIALFSSLGNVLYQLKFGQVGYNASNEFLQSFSNYIHKKFGVNAFTINWCDWYDVGMSVRTLMDKINTKDISIANSKILHGITPKEGVSIFHKCLQCKETVLNIYKGNLLEAINSYRKDRNKDEKVIVENAETVNDSVNNISNLEEKLFEIFSEFFGREDFDIDDDFFDIGGDSLKALTLIGRIHKTFNIKLSLTEFISKSSIRELIEYIKLEKSTKKKFESIPRAKEQSNYQLSSAQKRLYFLQQYDLESILYNMSYVIPLGADIKKEKIEEVFFQLIERHESFRTSFIMKGEEPVQYIHEKVEFRVEEKSIEKDELETYRQEFKQAFDLSQAPLLRVCKVNINGEDSQLIIDMHHIISDGVSHSILEKDFHRLFSGEELESLRLQYKDFSEWQNGKGQQEKNRKQENYWINKFGEEIPTLDLPTDYPRPVLQSHEGATVSFVLSKTETEYLKTLTKENGLTLYMSVLSVFTILLSKLSGQDDIIIGTPIAGRNHPDLENTVGMFVNTLAMRNDVKGDETIKEFVTRLKHTINEAFENQNYQFEDLVDKVSKERDTSRNPIFDVMLKMWNLDEYKVDLTEFDITEHVHIIDVSRFDLTLAGIDYGEQIVFNLVYCTKLFKQDTIERYIAYFKQIIGQLPTHSNRKLSALDILTSEEKQLLLYKFNDNKIDYSRDKTIHELFEEQVDKTPDSIALVFDNEQISYRELDNKSNQVAHYLRYECEIGINECVGIYMDEGINVIISILGILKSGCGYLPFSLSSPQERIMFMINDTFIRIIISEKGYVKEMNKLQWECSSFRTYLCLDSYNVYGEQETKNMLNDRKLWEYVGEESVDEVTGGGWNSSYTGQPMSQEEMNEYGDNVLKKIEPFITSQTRVLEIGCASGITMFRLAPKVGLYYGTDLSATILEKNEERIKSDGHSNIIQKRLSADEIDQIEEKDFDLVIINSVIHCFDGHNYLKKVIQKAIDLMKPEGIMFLGDIMDQDLKKDLKKDLEEFKQSNTNKDYKTTIDFSEKLLLSRGFWDDLKCTEKSIGRTEYSRKIYSIENELTKFRYDVLVSIDKNQKEIVSVTEKNKYQHDLNILKNYSTKRLSGDYSLDNLAYIIYTSGTTGKPKGALLNHKNLMNYFSWFNQISKLDSSDKTMLVTSFSFDLGYTGLYSSIISGCQLHLVPRDIYLSPNTFTNYIIKNRISYLKLTSSLYTLLIDDPKFEKSLKSLRLLVLGGEEINVSAVRYSLSLNSELQFMNHYGPTEGTIGCISFGINKSNINDYKNRPVIGKLIHNTKAYILDKFNKLQGFGIPGELCISGDGLALGYINNPELSEEKFIDNPYIPRERLYKTGDLACMLPNGNIEFLGRIDHQVKLRGFRIELGEIENVLKKHVIIKDSIVIAREENGDKYLCAYVVCNEDFDQEEIREYLTSKLPDYMVPSYLVELDQFPLTSNRKVNRKALPSPKVKAGADYVAPSNEIEEKLVEIWSEVLNIDKGAISTTANFFSIGGHSLKATVLTGKIHKEIGVEYSLRDVFIHSSIQAQVIQIETSIKKDFVSIPIAKEQDYYALSSAQKRLYLLQQMDLESRAYNMPYTISLGSEVDKVKIEEVFGQLISRHESFRTSFEIKGEEPVQRIHEQIDFKVEELTIEKEEVQNKRQQFIRAFDLSQAPLLRVALVNINGEGNLLLIDMHHIISDRVSHSILEREFQSLYSGEELTSLQLQYKDFSEWQNSEEQQDKIKDQELYWLKQFEGEILVLELPTDYVRPIMQSTEGATVNFTLSKKETENIKWFTEKNRLTLFMSVFSVFNILLSKLTGQEDIIVGAPVAGRNHSDLENIVGMFVNTLAIRNEVSRCASIQEFIDKIKQNTLEAFENQDYQFEDLVDQVSVERDTSRNPIFNVMFNLLSHTDYIRDLSGFETESYVHTRSVSKFDLTMTALDYGDQLMFCLDYCTVLFRPETIERYIGYFKHLVNQIVSNSKTKISEIEIISEEEKQQLLFVFNSKEVNYQRDKTIDKLFEEQVEKSPDKIALENGDQQLSYRVLNQKSNQVGHYLINKGLKLESIVGIMLDSSIDSIVFMLGILKSGGCYLPIEMRLPQERKNYILKDSGISFLVIDDQNPFDSDNQVITIVTNDCEEIWQCEQSNLENNILPNNLAYVIYTSGTTGKPKGTLLEHKGIVSENEFWKKGFQVLSNDRILQFASLSFDASVSEVFMSLLNGATLVLFGHDDKKDTEFFSRKLRSKLISLLTLPPDYARILNIECFKYVRTLVTAGSSTDFDLIEKFKDELKYINAYGPTETTICATALNITESELHDRISIGSPIENTQVYILGKNNEMLPIGITGELCISGVGLARGYIGQSVLTNEKFIDHPFEPGEKLYCTGDLARWLPDGNIEFLGRIDHQVKIRGFRIELGEIENVLKKYESIKESVVIVREENGDKYLCAYVVTEGDFNQEDILTFLYTSLPDYMIPSYFVELNSLPLTVNGKINKKGLPSPKIKAGAGYVVPSNELEEKLVEIWSEVLNIEKKEISTTDNFFTIGGHSLKATVLIGKIHKEIGVEYNLRDVFIHTNIQAQASQIGTSTKKDFVSISKAPEKDFYVLSSAQKRLYLLQQMDLESTVYNISYIISLGEDENKEKIEEVFRKLIIRHESFRTSFELHGEEPVQCIHQAVDFKIEEFRIEKEEIQSYRQEFIQAFDLSKAPLLRVAIAEIKGEGSMLLIDMHHIISDGVSQTILEKEFQQLYSGAELEPLRLQYKDYSEWQNSEEQRKKIIDQEDYWLSRFKGGKPLLNLPTDYERPAIKINEGATVSFYLDEKDTESLIKIAKESNATMFMLLLSVFNVFLSKLSGQEDITIGTAVACRRHSDLQAIIGMFVNMLVLRNFPEGEKSFDEFLKEVRDSTVLAFENQDYQFDDLVVKLKANRDASHNPLFDVVLNYQNQSQVNSSLHNYTDKLIFGESSKTNFDIILNFLELEKNIFITINYSNVLYKQDTIIMYVNYFKEIISNIINLPNKRLEDIKIVHEYEEINTNTTFDDGFNI